MHGNFSKWRGPLWICEGILGIPGRNLQGQFENSYSMADDWRGLSYTWEASLPETGGDRKPGATNLGGCEGTYVKSPYIVP